MGMLSLGIKGSRPKHPPADSPRIARGLGSYTHRVCSRAPLGKGIRPNSSKPATSTQRSGARPSPGLPIDGGLDPILGLSLALGASQGPRTRRHVSSHQGSGALRRCPASTALSTTPPTRSCTRRDVRKQTPSRPPGARGTPGPHVSPSSRPPLPPRSL
jgi:hypothetical protein